MQARRGTWWWVAALGGALWLGGPLAGCGGSNPEAKTGGKSTARGSDDQGVDEQTPDGYCLDGTCFDCGQSFCMLGWYCDESMAGGPGCSFVPECGGESECGCVEAAVGSGCSCEERDGGAYVHCK
jgi:hypothetical protein